MNKIILGENKDTEEYINMKKENDKLVDEKIEQTGQITLDNNKYKYNIYLLSIIGEIEGHETAAQSTKTTKYEHVLPMLASIEDNNSIDGILVLLQTTGGDCSAGLAIAEMLASISKPTVSLVIGDSHSIGVPLAVSTKYSYIVPSGTMIIHPVRMSGTIIGAPQTFEYFKIIQDRIVKFVSMNSDITEKRLEELMLSKGVLTKDLGTILVGEDAVKEHIIDEVGGISDALRKLYKMIEENGK